MPSFLEFSLVSQWVEPTPARHFCIRADASFQELRDAIMALTAWIPTSRGWTFILPRREGGEGLLFPLPPHVRGKAPEHDPEVTPLSSYFDPDRRLPQGCRYHHESSGHWRINVVLLGSWNVLDSRRRWLVHAKNPWPPYEFGSREEYARFYQLVREGPDRERRQALVQGVFQWSPELDTEALERRFER